jgi:hypothetical protein
MHASELIQWAQDAAQLNDFHSDSFREGLEVLLGDLDRSARLTAQGRTAIEQIFTNLLVSRLKVDDWLRTHPLLTSRAVERPVIIAGMPRSGTTLVSYLLDADSNRRSLLKWEVWNGVPPPASNAEMRTDPRCLAMKTSDEQNLNSEMAARHHEDADGPSECTFVVAQDFKSCFLEAMHPVPSYRDWLLETDMASAYETHKRHLQVLQMNATGIWNLKMPSHALFIDKLIETYPDAKIIWTHRDPYKTMGSLVSLIHLSHRLMGADDTLGYIADHYPRQISQHVVRMMKAEDQGLLHSGNTYHLFYHEMLADPIGEMRRIYSWLGDEFSPDIEARMERWLDEKPQGHFGKHEYSLEKQGLSVSRLQPYFAEYLRRYPIRLEGI